MAGQLSKEMIKVTVYYYAKVVFHYSFVTQKYTLNICT